MAPSTGLWPRIMLTVISIFTVAGSFAADFNATHVYNPRWPGTYVQHITHPRRASAHTQADCAGHAKFHNGQTMSLAIFLAGMTVWHAWFSPAQDGLLSASVLASGYFVTQLTAMLFPGATAWDPPQHYSMAFPQVCVIVPVLGVVCAAYWLEGRRLRGLGKGKMQ